jgi:hypothetical protein
MTWNSVLFIGKEQQIITTKRIASSPYRRCLQLLSTRRRITGPLYGKVEVGGGIRLVIQSEMPKFQVIVAETPSLHELQQQHAVGVCGAADVGVCVRRFVEAVEAAAHVYAAAGKWHRCVKRRNERIMQEAAALKQNPKPLTCCRQTSRLMARSRAATFVPGCTAPALAQTTAPAADEASHARTHARGAAAGLHQSEIQGGAPAVAALQGDVVGEQLRLVQCRVEFAFRDDIVVVAAADVKAMAAVASRRRAPGPLHEVLHRLFRPVAVVDFQRVAAGASAGVTSKQQQQTRPTPRQQHPARLAPVPAPPPP